MSQPLESRPIAAGDEAQFRQVESELPALRSGLAAGSLSVEQVSARLFSLIFRDGHGTVWSLGFQSGMWYYYNGASWVRTARQGVSVKKGLPAWAIVLIVILVIFVLLFIVPTLFFVITDALGIRI